MKIPTFIFVFFFISIGIAQNNCNKYNRKLKKIEKKVLYGDYSKVNQLLLKIDDTCLDPVFLKSLADIYYSIKNDKKAYDFYLKTYYLDGLNSMNSLSLSNFLKSSYMNGYYDVFNKIVSHPDFNKKRNALSGDVQNIISQNNFAFQSIKDSIVFNPVSLSINSDSDEYFPSMPINSEVIIYTYRNTNNDMQDENFYIARKKSNNDWSNPVKLGNNINSDFREGSLSVSLDGTSLFFASCNRPDSYGGCDLYISSLINDTTWSPSYNLGPVINSKYWESQPSISSDGNILFFTSNRHGGYGGADIWMVKKNNAYWSSPINLGPSINTAQDESTPFLHYDNQTFYFASKGHAGFGGFDLYKAMIDSLGNIDQVSNLGYPINTHHDESGLIVSQDGLTAYYNSDLKGDLDIYSFKLPENIKANKVAVIEGMIVDSISRKGLNANVIISLKDNFRQQNLTSNKGLFYCSLPLESSFSITVLCEGYDFFYCDYNLEKGDFNKKVNIVLNRLHVGNRMSLDNIYYEFDDYSLKEASLILIKEFAAYLILNSTLKIEIGGHTDNVGTEGYNRELSLKRAKLVYDMLVEYGVPYSQMTYKGYGYSRPLTKNLDDDNLKNRRTEVKVIK